MVVAYGVRHNSLLRGLYAQRIGSLIQYAVQKVAELTSTFSTHVQYIARALNGFIIDEIFHHWNEPIFPGEACAPPAIVGV